MEIWKLFIAKHGTLDIELQHFMARLMALQLNIARGGRGQPVSYKDFLPQRDEEGTLEELAKYMNVGKVVKRG